MCVFEDANKQAKNKRAHKRTKQIEHEGHEREPTIKKENKVASKQASQQTNKLTNKLTNKQANKNADQRTCRLSMKGTGLPNSNSSFRRLATASAIFASF